MDFFNQNTNFIVYQKPVNMHRSFNGLVSLAIAELNVNLAEQKFVLFMNRKRNQFKILFLSYGHISIFTMRCSGSIQMDFTKIDQINSNSFKKLIQTTKRRQPRFKHILEAKTV